MNGIVDKLILITLFHIMHVGENTESTKYDEVKSQNVRYAIRNIAAHLRSDNGCDILYG